MGLEGFERNLSEGSKMALQSETWQKVRRATKTEIQHFTEVPEIQHFATVKTCQNDNVYGVVWGEVVRKYLKTAYPGEREQMEIISDGIVYKALNRGEVTAFYDSDGNTLFDVENKRLEKEYQYVMKEDKAPAGSAEEIVNPVETEEKSTELEKADKETQEVKSEEKFGSDVPANGLAVPDPPSIKQMAKKKLEKEMSAEKDKDFAEPVIGYLLKRCEDDLGLAQDVLQEHKTWKKCFDYIYERAREQATGNRAAVRDDVVYEWAEDYYHKDDKAEEEKKVREAAKRKKKRGEKVKKAAVEPKKAEVSRQKEAPKPKKNSKDMDGQLDMFSMMGI